MPSHLPSPPKGRSFVVGAGKAAAAMAQARAGSRVRTPRYARYFLRAGRRSRSDRLGAYRRGPDNASPRQGGTTVTVAAGAWRANVEYLLALAIELDRAPGIWAIAGDTDGIDGTQDNAGAIITPDILDRARDLGLDPAAYLADNDAYGFFTRGIRFLLGQR